jgi:hypothetical protein
LPLIHPSVSDPIRPSIVRRRSRYLGVVNAIGFQIRSIDLNLRWKGGPESMFDVCFGSLADIPPLNCDVGFAPESGHRSEHPGCPVMTQSGHSGPFQNAKLKATISILTAAARGLAQVNVGGPIRLFLGTDIFVLALILFDYASRGQVHPAS